MVTFVKCKCKIIHLILQGCNCGWFFKNTLKMCSVILSSYFHPPVFRAKPLALASAVSWACFLFCSSRTMMRRRRKKARRRRPRKRSLLHLLPPRAAKTEPGDEYYLESVRILQTGTDWPCLVDWSFVGISPTSPIAGCFTLWARLNQPITGILRRVLDFI